MPYSCQIVLNRERNTEHKTRQNQGTHQIQLIELEQRLQTLCQQRDENLQETQRLRGVVEQQRRDWDQEKREWCDAHHDVHARDALEAQTKELQATVEAKKEMEDLLRWHTQTLESTRREADMVRVTAHTLCTRPTQIGSLPYRDTAPPASGHQPSHPSANQTTHSPPQRPSTLPTGDSALPQVRVSPRHHVAANIHPAPPQVQRLTPSPMTQSTRWAILPTDPQGPQEPPPPSPWLLNYYQPTPHSHNSEAATMKNTVYTAAWTITPFDPQKGHGDIEVYLMDVRQQVNYLGLLNEDSKITLITQSLAKGPKDWAFHYISEHHPTFDQFCHKLCRKYQAPTSAFAKIKALMDKKQGRQESPRDFFDGLNQAYTRNLPPQDYNPNLLREAFLDNLHNDIKGLVMAMATKTTSMPEIVSHAQQIWLSMGKKKLEQRRMTEVLAINSAQQGINLEGTPPPPPPPMVTTAAAVATPRPVGHRIRPAEADIGHHVLTRRHKNLPNTRLSPSPQTTPPQ
ncbi:hypothetical protein SKAU_G00209260 [Synaphobranchus kaupii]|uniref:Ty3 transposon capsid-like protein domain-containing protein n=1 Tax=Synaphobranchus kaupii TaxID=118154 RepID=A0A9Q1IUE5_SYNKA|nr:hypothetical protein SKAU_G00209260 [Synaphobranchus kaupii]